MTQQELPAPLAELTGLMAQCANHGDYAGAARQANELVTLCRATLGERHATVLELKVSLATLQLRAGDDAVAYDEFARLIPDLVEVLGRDHLSTLTARHLLAGRQQPSLSSLAEWSQLFADEQRILGGEHESVLVAREKIAEKRWDIGDVVGAIAEAEHVLAARRRVLGDGHTDTLGTRLMLAIWRGRAGDVPGAVADLEPLIDDLRERLGDGHAHLLMARHMFTLWAPERAGVTDEVAAWEALAEDEARVLGERHPVTLAARRALAGWCARHSDPARESGARGSGVMAGVYQGWRRAVDESAAAEPGRPPARQHAPGGGFSPTLDAWLIRQHHHFPEWAARCGGDWDYSPETIDRLTELVGRVTPTVGALRGPANREFIEGAMYYLGEMLRRRYPSRWVYREFHDDDDPDLANFRLQRNDDTGFTSPFYLLHLMLLEGGDPGRARAFYDDWVS